MTTAIQVEKPKRIQRSRVKGSKLPPSTICCTRPGRFGNKFTVGLYFRKVTPDWHGNEVVRDLEHSLELFEDYARARARRDPQWLAPLRNVDFLACWCRLENKRHVDIILRILRETTVWFYPSGEVKR